MSSSVSMHDTNVQPRETNRKRRYSDSMSMYVSDSSIEPSTGELQLEATDRYKFQTGELRTSHPHALMTAAHNFMQMGTE